MSKKPPLCSSDQIVRALERAGCEKAHVKGSHQTMKRTTPERTHVTVVVLGLAEVDRWTLKSIVELAGLTMDEFRSYMKLQLHPASIGEDQPRRWTGETKP